MQQSNVLRVLTGLHEGASVSLPRPGFAVIGSAQDCDLILLDEGIASRHAAIVLHESGTAVRALEGIVRLNGRELMPGRASATWDDAQISLGTATLVVSRRAEPAVPSKPATRTRTVAALSACAVAAVLGGATLLQMPRSEAQSEPPESRIASLLEELGLAKEVTSSTSADGSITLTGTTHDEASYAKLLRGLAEQHLAPAMQVTSRERLASDVRNVFRVNGMDVEAEYAQAGVVKVRGLSAARSDVDRVIQHAMRDVRGLKEIRIEGASLDAAPAPVDAAAKRVVSIVDGSPAYVVTADGARYFVGATLPQGQRVVAIQGNAVTLERNGERLIMNF